MPRPTRPAPPSRPQIEHARADPDAAPLSARMRHDAQAARESLAAFGFSPEAYESILERAAATHGVLTGSRALHAANRLTRLIGAFEAAINAPVSDPAARGRAYLALLDTVLLQSLVAEAASPKWIARIDRECARLEEGRPDASLALLTVAGMAAESGATVTPHESGAIVVTFKAWRLGLVAAHAPSADAIPARVADGVARLKAARLPGMVVLDLAEAVCPEQRPLRATHPDAGAGELRARLDRLLQDSRQPIRAACDPDYAVGVVGAAFLALHLVSADQVAFLTAYRMMSLLDPADPRERKLGALREAFGDL
jgi:hypothetical protein